MENFFNFIKKQMYRHLVFSFAKSSSVAIIPNGDPFHATALTEAMFFYGKKEILLFGELSRDIYKSRGMKKSIKKFMQRDSSSLKIIVDVPNGGKTKINFEWFKNHPIYKAIENIESLEKKLSLAFISRNAKGIGKDSVEDPKHFSTMDDCSFRYEYVHAYKEDGKPDFKAFANFNDPEFTKQLKEEFEHYFKIADKIEIETNIQRNLE